MAQRKSPRPTALQPALLQQGKPLSKREALALDRSLAASSAEKLITQLGGRMATGELLAIAADEIGESSESGPISTLADLLLDPRFDRYSITDLCGQAGLSLRDLFRSYRTAALTRAQILSTEKIAALLPAVVEDVMVRAAPHQITCPTCLGTMTTTSPKKPDAPPEPCADCRGMGTISVEPELDRQKLALELGDLVKKGGGIAITNQQLALGGGNGVGGGGGGSTRGGYERMQQALIGALASPLSPVTKTDSTDAIEVDVTQEDERA